MPKKQDKKDDDSIETGQSVLVTLLASFGLVAVFYGFEGVIDSIPLFANNPIALLITGIVVLVATGTIYSKL